MYSIAVGLTKESYKSYIQLEMSIRYSRYPPGHSLNTVLYILPENPFLHILECLWDPCVSLTTASMGIGKLVSEAIHLQQMQRAWMKQTTCGHVARHKPLTCKVVACVESCCLPYFRKLCTSSLNTISSAVLPLSNSCISLSFYADLFTGCNSQVTKRKAN